MIRHSLAGSIFVFVLLLSCQQAAGARKNDYPLSPVPFNRVKLADHFWLPRLKTQIRVTVPHALEQTEPAVENLRRCANIIHGRGGEKPFTHRFISSDLYKVMEGAAYLLMIQRDPALEKRMDEIIAVIADAQQDDGYLYVAHECGVANPKNMGERPYCWVVHSHELYNMGHMYEGAVAYYRATGKDAWLKVAEKSARHIYRVFFEGDPRYNDGKPVMQAPGHEEIELALCKLYRVTGTKLYLDMAKRFLDIRGVTYRPDGEGVMAPTYAQQHKPVREQQRAVGHAVRAGYLYAGMADVSALTGDTSYLPALDRIWHNIVDTKMHITGGLGAVRGIEGFGPEYVLPNKDAYNETCAAVANVFFNFRMYLLHQDARYFDVAEVALLNNALAGVSLDGDSFFYVNPLEADGKTAFNHRSAGRAPWFGCACCPSNIARLIPQVPGYMYAHTDHEIYLTLYGGSRTRIELADGAVAIEQRTEYPFDGRVHLTLKPGSAQRFTLKLRIPTWAREKFVPGELYSYMREGAPEWWVKVNGRPVEARLERGFAAIRRVWQPGDRVELHLPMPVRFCRAIDKVEADRGRVAVVRGPLVYCAEEVDNHGPVQRLFVPEIPRPGEIQTRVIQSGPLAGVVAVSLPGRELTEDDSRPTRITLVPYYAWNNRGEKSMIVWLPQSEALARSVWTPQAADAQAAEIPSPAPSARPVKPAAEPQPKPAAKAAQHSLQPQPAPRPNILIILADDLGYSDIGCFGGEIDTPNLDRLAAGGVRFTQFYNAARCCPSRAALLTGLYPHQAGIGMMVYRDFGPGYRGRLVPECVTLGEVLHAAGYQTMMVGKWHAGHLPESRPEVRGFERFTGVYPHIDSYWKVLRRCDIYRDGRLLIPAGENPTNPYHPDQEFYTTDFFTDVALDYIQQAASDPSRPFFLHLCYNAPHFPLEAPEELIEKYRGRYMQGWDRLRKEKFQRMKRMGLLPAEQKLPEVLGFDNQKIPGFTGVGVETGPLPRWDSLSKADQRELDFRRAMYAAQVERLDQNIGRIVEELRRRGLLENTVIMFLSDNGCSGEMGLFGMNWGKYTSANYSEWRKLGGWSISQGQCWAAYSNTPLRKYKKFVHEGGIATPLVVHWPAGIAQPGRLVTRQVGHLIDIMPTLCELSGAAYPEQFRSRRILPAQGISLVPWLVGTDVPPVERTLFWQHENHAAVRRGDWKLVTSNDRDPKAWELYDLSNDRSETENLAARRPEVLGELTRLWKDWGEKVHAVPFPEHRQLKPTPLPLPQAP